jgi:hypothetical protein
VFFFLEVVSELDTTRYYQKDSRELLFEIYDGISSHTTSRLQNSAACS